MTDNLMDDGYFEHSINCSVNIHVSLNQLETSRNLKFRERVMFSSKRRQIRPKGSHIMKRTLCTLFFYSKALI